MPTLDDLLQQVRTLPPAPRILKELLPLLHGNDTDITKIVDLIAYDPGLTAKLLIRCKSVTLSLAKPVESVEDAVRQLGFNEVYHLLTMLVGQFAAGTAQNGYGKAGTELWRNAARTAFASRFVARTFDGDEKAAFTAGLLHDIGRLLLYWALVDGYPGVAQKVRDLGPAFSDPEKEMPRLDYAELGGRVLAHWRFSDNLVRVVWHQYAIHRAHPYEQLAAFVRLGGFIAHSLGVKNENDTNPVLPCADVLALLELTSQDLDALILDVGTALKEESWILEG